MAFHFNQGDRPLPGYTIQYGVGRGGFGEVYYAKSDGGKEVALKYLRENPQVELRGVTHCLNLKSPYLVATHDIRQNPEGDHFVIMEYVNGPSLRDLMNTEGNGLGPQKAAYFLREIGKGLAYLHDRGIVHRDLKPGNIFYEDGYVKIGDYGLAKIMASSQHSGQTVSVGTVHYMAPEVGSGNYDRTIDIYALGVMLYEMLLGRVPFSGSSMGEVLMKHLTAQPEVDELPDPFPRVIRKALAKDPKDRYQTVTEMVSELFEVEDLSKSVAAFEPMSLTTLGAQAARDLRVEAPVGGVGTGSSNVGQDRPPPVIHPEAETQPAGVMNRLEAQLGAVGKVIEGIDGSLSGELTGLSTQPRSRWSRIIFALIICGVASVGVSARYDAGAHVGVAMLLSCLTMTFSILVGHFAVSGLTAASSEEDSRWIMKIASASTAALLLFLLYMIGTGPRILAGLFSDAGLVWVGGAVAAIVFGDWAGRIQDGRQGQINASSAFSIALFALIPAVLGDLKWLPMAAVLAATSLMVELLAGLWPIAQKAGDQESQEGGLGDLIRERGGLVAGAAIGISRGVHDDSTASDDEPSSSVYGPEWERSGSARAMWIFSAALLLFGSVLSFVAPAVLNWRGDAFGASIVTGIVLAVAFIFAVVTSVPKHKMGLWRGIFRQAVFFASVALSAACGASIGLFNYYDHELLIALSAVIFGGLMMVFVWFIPMPEYAPQLKPATLDEKQRRLRTAGRVKYAGIGAFCVAAALTPIFLLAVDERNWGEALIVVVLPLLAVGLGLTITGAVMAANAKEEKPKKVDLPIRKEYLLDSIDMMDSTLERYTAMLGYTLRKRGDLLWSFTRGDWWSQCWHSDIRRWKTNLNIAAYVRSEGGYRIVCFLDVESGLNSPDKSMLQKLDAEMEELQDFLGGRELQEAGREIAV